MWHRYPDSSPSWPPQRPSCCIALSPFMRYTSIMGHERYEKFAQSISKLNNFCDRWSQYKRIIDLYNRGNRTYLTAEIWKMLPKEHFPCRNEFEISRAVHMIEVLYFIGVLRADIISDLSLSTSVVHLAPDHSSFRHYHCSIAMTGS